MIYLLLADILMSAFVATAVVAVAKHGSLGGWIFVFSTALMGVPFLLAFFALVGWLLAGGFGAV